MHQDD